MKRQISGLVQIPLLAALILFATPALAAAAQSFTVTSPTGFPAGGHPTYTTGINLDTSAGSPGKVGITLAPGVLASVSANPGCVKGAPQYTSTCQIGTGSATALGLVKIPLNAYLVKPPSSGDLVGIDLVTSTNMVTHAGAALVQTAGSKVSTVLHLDLASLNGLQGAITSMSLTVDGTLQGKPFTRMPTNCSPGSSKLTITYANKTETSTASPDFKPTGCASLPFHPKLTGSAVQDLHDAGAAVTTTVTQGADEAASSSTTLLLPWPTLAPNFSSLGLENKPIPVGSASTATPLLPTPLVGKVYFTGTPTAPTLTLRFPPPAVLTLVGSVSLAQHSVVFSDIPDVPVTNLTVALFGGPKALLAGACNSPTGTLGGAFGGQNGLKATASLPITLANCPATKPSAPKLTHVSFAPRAFKAKSGTHLKFILSESGTVTVLVKRTVHGHRAHHTCSAKAKRGAKCTVHLKRTVRFKANAGVNAFAFKTGKLPKGTYTAQVSAVDASGHGSNKVKLTFQIK